MENDFHDVVNQDQVMYDNINSAPDDYDDKIGSITGIVQKHVSEVWAPPRVTALAKQYGLNPGSAYDIETSDSNGKPWDFDIPEQRNQCVREILVQRPAFLIGSPMCTAFSILQGLNKTSEDPDKYEAMWNKGVGHMIFGIQLYRTQSESGRFVLHEHPASASSWKLPEMVSHGRAQNQQDKRSHVLIQEA